ncbi:hypothetical protein B0H63DRAFT_448176 [Podospora didyma]|uniref:Heterokaryon incompatibility domain-containing protein n=1 Tax=Podospora didyma TaxID=330526 RepID=A0AAE0NTC3_9PEZI|nr:hypothetical protein B0H63DRAFT_448176 [Podospora didyma]
MPHQTDGRRFLDLWSSPLHKRAWVFQECALSPRTVYFGDTLRIWQDVVKMYSSAMLINESDGVIALGGVIDLVKNYTGLRCHAGLWAALLLEQLAWRRDDPREAARNKLAPSWSWMSMGCPVTAGPCPLEPSVHLSKVLPVNTRLVSQKVDKQLRIEGDIVIKGSLFRITKLEFWLNQSGDVPQGHLVVEA